MIKSNDKEYLARICETHVCPEHGHKLVVAWHAGVDNYVIRCSEGHFPKEVTRELTPIEEHKAGKREAHEPITSLLPRTDLATGELLVPEVVKALMEYAYKYDLDPYRGHVVMMYGKPHIGLDGYLYHAMRQATPYQLKSRPLEDGERKSMMINEGDHAWKAELEFLDPYQYFSGIGIVTLEEMTARSSRDTTKFRSPVVAAHPWQLAQKRAEWQALRRAFPIGESEEEKVDDRQQKEDASTMAD